MPILLNSGDGLGIGSHTVAGHCHYYKKLCEVSGSVIPSECAEELCCILLLRDVRQVRGYEVL